MQRELQRLFEERQVQKVYEAVISGQVAVDEGTIDLPLFADPELRPRQIVDAARGKPASTKFQVIERSGNQTRLELYPITGRTHQLRVHTAIGLGCPIVGDRLYGDGETMQRLHLHAKELQLPHPTSQGLVRIKAPASF
jgi:tRNA pseudouridine32 synthase/23S rRNA pseudouridine746 synthase